MPRVRALQSDLSAGELGRALEARRDLPAYFQGARLLKNFRPLISGGAIKRAGTQFMGAVAADKTHKLVPFVVGRATAYQLEFEHLKLRIRDRDTGAYLKNGASDIVLTTPYSHDGLDGIYFAQSADVMPITHADRDVPMKALKRYAVNNWQFDDYTADYGPFLGENSSSTTLSFSSTTGASITVTASAAVFNSDMVGGLFLVRPKLAALSNAAYGGSDAAAGWVARDGFANLNDFVANEGRVYKLVDANGFSASGSYPPIHDEGTASDGHWDYTYVHDGYGVIEITAVASATSATAKVLNTLPTTGPTKHWNEGAFSDFRGWPAVCVFHQERFWVMNTPSQPDTAHASRSSGYGASGANFRAETAYNLVSEDDAISATLADGEINPVVAAVSADQLYLFSENSVKRITGPSPDEAITVSSRIAREVSTFGCRARVRPAKAHNAILYPSPDGRLLYELPTLDGAPRELTVRARHVGGSPIVEVQWVGYPDEVLYVRREDGRVFGMVYNRGENIVAFFPVELGGSFNGGAPFVESLSVIPNSDGRDELWMIVKRTVDGSTVRHNERLVREWDRDHDRDDEQPYLDAFVLTDHWNADTGKTITVTLDTPGADKVGDSVTLQATGHTPFSGGQVGDEVWVRLTNVPARAGDEPGPLRAIITEVTDNDTVIATLETSAPAALLDVALYEWAFASAAISGLDHLEGESVFALADGAPMGPFTVASGAITLDRPAARIYTGLKYEARIKSMPLEVGSQFGQGMGSWKSMGALSISYMDGRGGRVGLDGKTEANFERLPDRTAADVVGRAPAPVEDGEFEVEPDTTWERSQVLSFIHDEPCAITVRGLSVLVDING